MGCTHLVVCLILMVPLSLNFSGIASGSAVSIGFSPTGRKLFQLANASGVNTQSDDTVRVDPLDGFNKYRGGFDVNNHHYWSSTIFTGIYGYAIGVLWLLGGIVYGAYSVLSTLCCRTRNKSYVKRRSDCHKQCTFWPIILIASLTVLALTASGVVLGGSARFHSKAKTVMNIIIDTADEASQTIYNTTSAMRNIQNSLEATSTSVEASSFLTSTSQQLNSQANDIQRQARKNRRSISRGLKIVYLITTIIVSLNLITVIALSVFGLLKSRRAVKWFIIMCWLFTALCWAFFGAYFFLDKFAGDACTAFNNFQEDPYNNTLSSILPCDELLSAGSVLDDVSSGIYNLVNQINANISQSQGASIPVQVCNPFSGPPDYRYMSGICPPNSVQIGDIPQVLRPLVCSGDNGSVCISSRDFNAIEAYTTSLQDLLSSYPQMESLLQCQVVRDAFSEILREHCSPMKRFSRMVWIPLVILSAAVMILTLTWVAKAHHERAHHFTDGSVRPQYSSEDTEGMEISQPRSAR